MRTLGLTGRGQNFCSHTCCCHYDRADNAPTFQRTPRMLWRRVGSYQHPHLLSALLVLTAKAQAGWSSPLFALCGCSQLSRTSAIDQSSEPLGCSVAPEDVDYHKRSVPGSSRSSTACNLPDTKQSDQLNPARSAPQLARHGTQTLQPPLVPTYQLSRRL